MTDFFKIGIITGAHGVNGDTRVLPCTFDINRFSLLDVVDVKTENDIITYKIEDTRFHKQFVIIKFKEINSRDEAMGLKGASLIIPRGLALPLSDDEYYAADLYDMKAVSDTGEELGVIADIITTGANDVYVIKKEGAQDLLVPAIKKCILKVDVKERLMKIHLIEGLR